MLHEHPSVVSPRSIDCLNCARLIAGAAAVLPVPAQANLLLVQELNALAGQLEFQALLIRRLDKSAAFLLINIKTGLECAFSHTNCPVSRASRTQPDNGASAGLALFLAK